MEQLDSSELPSYSLTPTSVDMHDGDDSSCKSISQLPAELMCRIFLFVRWAYETDSNLIPYSEGCLQWIQACSHVNQHWRKIAINYPILWANPSLHRPLLRNVMLQRSKAAPLSFVVDLSLNHLAGATYAVIHNAHLVRSLEVWCDQRLQNFTEFINILPENFTILQELSINHGRRPYPGFRYQFDDDDDESIRISEEQLFPWPALRTISLKHVNISYNSGIFGETITQLSIVHVPRPARFNAQELRSMLACMPNLTDLCLSNACRDGERSVSSPRGVQLSQLKTIGMGSSVDAIGLLFDSIETTSTLYSIRLHFGELHRGNPTNIDMQLDRLLSRFSHPCWSGYAGQGTAILSIAQGEGVVGDGAYDFSASLSSHPMKIDAIGFSLGICIYPGLHDYDRRLAKNRYITEVLFRQLFCSNLYALSLNDNLDVPSDTLATTFGTLKQLAIIYVHGPCTYSLVEALQRGYCEDNIFLTPNPLPFPALQYLRLTNHTFDDWLDRNPLSLDELRMCLTRRLEWGAPIPTLELDRCYHNVSGEFFEFRELLPEEVDCFGDLVNDIIWDEL